MPLVRLPAVALRAVLMAFLGRTTWIAFLAWRAIGPVLYFGCARRRSRLE